LPTLAKALVTKNENSTIKAKINTREEIAKIAGTSHDTIAKVKKISNYSARVKQYQ